MIKVITLEIVEQFLLKSRSIDLSDFNLITDETAVCLIKIDACFSLNGLKFFSDAAESLGKIKGWIILNG